jgi:hypothetical protein
MSDFTLPAWVLDSVLLFTVLEYMVLGLRYKRTRSGLNWAELSLGLAPGFLLMLTFRVSEPSKLNGPSLLCLALAGLVHTADFYRRYRQKQQAIPAK